MLQDPDCCIIRYVVSCAYSSNLFPRHQGKMQAQDRQEKERADARNALEEYVYELRGKLSEGEVLHDFVADDQRARLVAHLDALEQWLYDEGEDQNRQVRCYNCN